MQITNATAGLACLGQEDKESGPLELDLVPVSREAGRAPIAECCALVVSVVTIDRSREHDQRFRKDVFIGVGCERGNGVGFEHAAVGGTGTSFIGVGCERGNGVGFEHAAVGGAGTRTEVGTDA